MHSPMIGLGWFSIPLVLLAIPVQAQIRLQPVGGNQAAANEVLVKFREGNAPSLTQALEATRIDGARGVGANGWVLLHSGTASAASLVRTFQLGGDVASAEPNYVVHANLIPDDPLWPQLYGMVRISAPDAWDITTGSTANVAGVGDTGISYDQQDLADSG